MRYFYYTIENKGCYISNIVKSPIDESEYMPLSDIITDAQLRGASSFKNIHIIFIKEISEKEYEYCKKIYGF